MVGLPASELDPAAVSTTGCSGRLSGESPATPVNLGPLDTASVTCAESRSSLRPDRWNWLEIREYLVLKHDGKTVRFPVRDGDVAQARLRASLSQHPDDHVVAVTEDAYIRLGSDASANGRFAAET